MRGAVEELTFTELHIQEKPIVVSHDSGSECSLEHWMEVYWLVEEEYRMARVADGENAGWK